MFIMLKTRKFSKFMCLSNKKILTKETMNEELVKMPLAIRSEVAFRVKKLMNDLKNGVNLPFDRILNVNMGDPQGVGQPPITFLRQVLSLCLHPKLIDTVNYPEDVKKRAEFILSHCINKDVGSLTDPQGIFIIRKDIADYIMNRDNGIKCDPNNLILLNGSANIQTIFHLIYNSSSDKPSGIMIPIPTYPMYHALLNKYRLKSIKYFLDEDNLWSLSIDNLKIAIDKSRLCCNPKAIVVINPGNPTGQVLSRKNIEDIIKLCYDEGLFIIADEVYQQNVYDKNRPFHSFKKVKYELGPPYSDIELISIYSASKGIFCECGLRGSCFEFDKIDKDVINLFLKEVVCTNLCPNISGQIALDVCAKPPQIGDASYENFLFEKTSILKALADKSKMLVSRLNTVHGINLNPVQGGIFAYASIYIPKKAIKEAEKLNKDPSLLWCLQLVDRTGIALVPGCSFLQKTCTYHFRITILPPVNVLDEIINGIEKFHKDFLKRYE